MSMLAFFMAHLISLYRLNAADFDALTVGICDFGNVYAFRQVECSIPLENHGSEELNIEAITPVSSRDKSTVKNIKLKAGATGYLPVVIDTEDVVGEAKRVFHFRVKEFGEQQFRAFAQGFVLTSLDTQPEIKFGLVDVNQRNFELSAELGSREVSSFQITGIVSKPDWIEASVSAGRPTIVTAVRANGFLGLHKGEIKVAINTPNQPYATIPVSATVRGEVVPSFETADFGAIRSGSVNELRIRLTDSLKRPFSVRGVEVQGIEANAEIIPCQPNVSDCKLLQLTLSNKQPFGLLKGSLTISFRGLSEKLQIPITGWLLDKNLKIKTLTEKDLEDHQLHSAAASRDSSPNLAETLKTAVQRSDEQALPGSGPLLRWSVANIGAVHGFQIFRSNSEDGPFLLINPTIIDVRDDSEPTNYQYRDNSAEARKIYWYYVGVVYKDGHKQVLTDPQRVVAK